MNNFFSPKPKMKRKCEYRMRQTLISVLSSRSFFHEKIKTRLYCVPSNLLQSVHLRLVPTPAPQYAPLTVWASPKTRNSPGSEREQRILWCFWWVLDQV